MMDLAKEAAANGSGVNSEKALDKRTPSSATTICSTSVKGKTAQLSCKRDSAVKYTGGTKSGRVESNCPNFIKVGPNFSRSAANSSAFAAGSVVVLAG